MLGCEMCSQVIFARSPLKLLNLLGVASLLDDKAVVQYVRETAVMAASRPTALTDLLREPITDDHTLTSESSPRKAANE